MTINGQASQTATDVSTGTGLMAIASAINRLASSVDAYRESAEANAGKLATAITYVSHGSTWGPTGLEMLSMAINGEGSPGQSPLSQTISDAINGLAEAVRESRETP